MIEHKDPFFQRFFARVPSGMANTFTNEQLAVIKSIYGSRQGGFYVVYLRFSVPILKFYLVILAGKEKRYPKRLSSEKHLYPIFTKANFLAVSSFLGLLVITGLGGGYLWLSYLKSTIKPTYPVSIPWISNQFQCEQTDRIWRDKQCWDSEHSPEF